MPVSSLAPEPPDARESALAAEASRRLAPQISGEALRLHLADGQELVLPPLAAQLLADLLAELAAGNAVDLLPLPAHLSLQQAADLLNVSRSFLLHLLDTGRLPAHNTGLQRHIQLTDLRAFQSRFETEREQVMRALARQAQELGMGY
jgi:excisionase family DNA binding protein